MQVRADDPRHPRVAPLVAEHIADQLGNTPAGFAFVLGADALAAELRARGEIVVEHECLFACAVAPVIKTAAGVRGRAGTF